MFFHSCHGLIASTRVNDNDNDNNNNMSPIACSCLLFLQALVQQSQSLVLQSGWFVVQPVLLLGVAGLFFYANVMVDLLQDLMCLGNADFINAIEPFSGVITTTTTLDSTTNFSGGVRTCSTKRRRSRTTRSCGITTRVRVRPSSGVPERRGPVGLRLARGCQSPVVHGRRRHLFESGRSAVKTLPRPTCCVKMKQPRPQPTCSAFGSWSTTAL